MENKKVTVTGMKLNCHYCNGEGCPYCAWKGTEQQSITITFKEK